MNELTDWGPVRWAVLYNASPPPRWWQWRRRTKPLLLNVDTLETNGQLEITDRLTVRFL